MRRACVAMACLLAGHGVAGGAEVQRHGLDFEEWVRETFFDGYVAPSYTQKWDIPAEANTRHGGIPVNPKATKYRHAIGMGDALRQFRIDETFLLIVGYWRQEGDSKRFVNLVVREIPPALWRRLWEPVTEEDLERLRSVVTDPALSIPEARRRALEMKARPPFSEAVMQVNPKIDRSQRRLQCSIRYDDVFRHIAPGQDPGPQERLELFGVPLPGPFVSPPRSLPAEPAEAVSAGH